MGRGRLVVMAARLAAVMAGLLLLQSCGRAVTAPAFATHHRTAYGRRDADSAEWHERLRADPAVLLGGRRPQFGPCFGIGQLDHRSHRVHGGYADGDRIRVEMDLRRICRPAARRGW